MTQAPSGLEIVPWKPIPHVLALQLWPAILESRQKANSLSHLDSVIFLPGPHEEQGGPVNSSPMEFEFQTQQMQPSPSSVAGHKKMRRGKGPTL